MHYRQMNKISRMIWPDSLWIEKFHARNRMMAAKHLQCAPRGHSSLTDVETTHIRGTGRDLVSTAQPNSSTTLTRSFSIALRHTGASARTDSRTSHNICLIASCWRRISFNASLTCSARCSWIHTSRFTRSFSTLSTSWLFRIHKTFTTGSSSCSRDFSTNSAPICWDRWTERFGRRLRLSSNTSQPIFRCTACLRFSPTQHRRPT